MLSGSQKKRKAPANQEKAGEEVASQERASQSQRRDGSVMDTEITGSYR